METSERKEKMRMLLSVLLRVVAFCATLSATFVMALNKEHKSFVVATIGNNPIRATVTAKFQHTPANVFFVITQAMASFHSLAMLGLQSYGQKLALLRGHHHVLIAILDMLFDAVDGLVEMTLGLASAGASAATFMAELGKNGNSHARWDKVCDQFESFCAHASWALLASFIGLCLLMVLSVMSIFAVQKKRLTDLTVVP